MRELVCSYMGIPVYQTATGAYEAAFSLDDGMSVGLSSFDLKALLSQIEKLKGF